MSISRWTVTLCDIHGLSEEECCLGASEPFEVVRATGARSSDPDTSKLAALRHEPRAGSQRAKVLAAIDAARFHGRTAREAADIAQVDGGWKRVSELAQGGHIVEQGSRTCMQTGQVALVYVAAVYAPAGSLF